MKIKVTHTLGPWAVQCQGRNETIYILGPEPRNIFIANLCSDLRWDDSFANANLIAAAPDLLEALECLKDEQNGPPLLAKEDSWNDAMEMALIAIAKAKGKTND